MFRFLLVSSKEILQFCIAYHVQGVSEKTLFKDFYTPGPRDRMMSVVTILLSIVLVKVVGEMLDDD